MPTPRRTDDSWVIRAADPEGPDLDAALESLLARQRAAHAAATAIAGTEPLGLRVIDLGDGDTHVLCAFDGPRFLCLRHDGTPEPVRRHVIRHAAAGLLWEHAEGLIDASRLDELAVAGARLRTLDLPARVAEAVDAAVGATIPLLRWRRSPLRNVVDMPQLDVATALHDDTHRAFGGFVTATDPLAADQASLSPDLIEALGAFERASVDAGVTERLGDRINAMLVPCDQAATEMADAHLTPLNPG